ncbi:unnamed protein product [Linum tenue]|uniref:Secreted protein n=1 Tax=Linum tenue TaxID=586396 RepID=A0AAV0KUT0_9ROSI|nr:unnamed protein product [Linum tenue]
MHGMSTTGKGTPARIVTILLLILSVFSVSLAYQPGDRVPMSKMGQYHCARSLLSHLLPSYIFPSWKGKDSNSVAVSDKQEKFRGSNDRRAFEV